MAFFGARKKKCELNERMSESTTEVCQTQQAADPEASKEAEKTKKKEAKKKRERREEEKRKKRWAKGDLDGMG